MFYLVCENVNYRSQLIAKLKENNFHAVFHYLSLHSSEYYNEKHDGRELVNSDNFSDCLVRLPLFYELKVEEIVKIIEIIKS